MQYAYLAVKRLFDEFLNTHARERTLLFVIDIKTPVVRLALYLVWAVFLSCHNSICFFSRFSNSRRSSTHDRYATTPHRSTK